MGTVPGDKDGRPLVLQPEGIADGQIVAYDAAQNKMVPLAAPGGIRLDYNENVSNVSQTIAGTSTANGTPVDITGLTITVPISSKPVVVKAHYFGVQTVVGTGEAQIILVETTGGGSTIIEVASQFLANSASARGRSFSMDLEVSLGATVAVRTFKIQARCDSVNATVPSFSVFNGSSGRSWVKAVTE